MTGMTAIACPCGGHTVTLSPDKPPVGGRAAFTCPACGERRTFVRTVGGAVFDGAPDRTPPPAPAPDPALTLTVSISAPPWRPAGPDLAPSPVPAGASVVLAALADLQNAAAWAEAVETTFPSPDWHVLFATDPDQARADLLAHAPAVVVAGNGPATTALLAGVAALPGRVRERLALVLVGDFTDNDAMAAFARSADAVLDAADTGAMAGRLRAARDGRHGLPSLFEAD
uniref:Zinc finger/thioredoxin putative domain-containing protein n=1 Tax=Desulfovibrio sp. U5L TaxID=596152 RepID=I2Q4S1_9BACT